MSVVNINPPWPSTDSLGVGYGVRHRRVSSGGNGWGKPNPYQLTIYEHWTAPLITQQIIINGKPTGPIVEKSSQSEPVFTSTDLTNKTLNKLWGDVKGADFNAAISGAELPKSIKMIGDTALKLRQAYSTARKGLAAGISPQSRRRFMAAASNVLTGKGGTADGKVANNWLELQYGWLPLVNDMYEGSKFVESKLQTIKQNFSVRSQADERCTSNCTPYAAKQCKRTLQYIVELTEKVPLSAQLGLTDPLSIAWELMPYSFVIDWAMPIGPYLEAVTAARSLRCSAVIATSCLKTEVSGYQTDASYARSGGGNFHLERVVMTRNVGSGVPNAKLPAFKPLDKVASVGHTLNALALLQKSAR
jgi:hypothetical protein